MRHSLLIGDVRDRLSDIAPGTVQTCITSPPYWGLRDYGVEGQIGSERTPEEFVATMVDVFRLVRETLRDDGTLWLNLGDSYATDSKWGGSTSGKHASALHGSTGIGRQKTTTGIALGNQLLMPHRVALALQGDGWILRSTVCWHKKNPMPESIRGWQWVPCRIKTAHAPREHKGHERLQGARADDGVNFASGAQWAPCPGCAKCEPNGGLVLRKGSWRPTTGHEYVFLFSKSPDYYADSDAVAEVASGAHPGNKSHKGLNAYNQGDEHMRTKVGLASMVASETRNPRSVWTLSSEPFRGAHFATFPSELVRRMLLATSPFECCGRCGVGYAPVVTKERVPTRPGTSVIPIGDSGANRDPQRHIQRTVVTGYQPTCRCNAPPARAIVLDPFAGSGTTLQVARHYGRDSIGIELSETYAAMARERIEQTPRCAVSKQQRRAKTTKPNAQRKLFD